MTALRGKRRGKARNLILSGFMGCGKSTVGRLLAARLRWRFVDLDAVIARRASLSVAGIFRKKGEAGFRAAESRAIRALPRLERCVIAIGGGAPLSARNRTWLKRAGHVAYIEVPVNVLVGRLARCRNRPLLYSARGDRGKLRGLVSGLLRRRRPFYMRADTCVAAGGRSSRELAGLILNKVSRKLDTGGEYGL